MTPSVWSTACKQRRCVPAVEHALLAPAESPGQVCGRRPGRALLGSVPCVCRAWQGGVKNQPPQTCS